MDIRYYNKEEILELNIPETIKNEIVTKFNKRVYYDCNDTCKIGVLIGLLIRDNEIFFIVKDNNYENYVEVWKSLSLL